MTRRLAVLMAALLLVSISVACNKVKSITDAGSDTDTDTDTDSDTDTGDPINPCEGASEGDPCAMPGMDEPECDFEGNFVVSNEGFCDEGGDDGGLYCDGHSVDCNDVSPAYCDEENNAVRDRTYACVEPEEGEAHCDMVDDFLVTDCDDLAETSYCGEGDDNDVVYTSETFTCTVFQGGCVADAPVALDDCELYELMCENGVCVEPPECYEAELGDPCDTGLPDHCIGNVLYPAEGHCNDSEMVMQCFADQQDCAPLTCIEDSSGAHCG